MENKEKITIQDIMEEGLSEKFIALIEQNLNDDLGLKNITFENMFESETMSLLINKALYMTETEMSLHANIDAINNYIIKNYQQ